MDIWPVIHAERKALASDLRSLQDDLWSTTSLCSEWTVRDVLAHMTATHSEDIRRALGLEHAYPTEAVVQAADFFKGSNMIIGTKRRIAGLTLRATDARWSTGTGPEVSGPILSLLMAMTGRAAASTDLTGDGVQTLAARP
jgi:Mycothiol maleylpyruvate isomerase N-terminal domain